MSPTGARVYDPPIVDPHREKLSFEKRSPVLLWPPPAFEDSESARRIVEVYRLCFELDKALDVVEDFVAHFPLLVFDAPWLAELVKRDVWRYEDWSKRDGPNALLRVLAKGFGRGAQTGKRLRRSRRSSSQFALQLLRKEIYKELKALLAPVDIKALKAEKTREARERLGTLVSERVAELMKRYPTLAGKEQKLRTLLCNGRAYDASILILAHTAVGKVLRVSARSMERKQSSE